MSKEKEIVTINNETKPISKCRRFEGGYYLIGDLNVEESGDCYLIGNKYYRMETGQVVFDHEKKEHVLKNDNLVNGVIGFEDKEPIMGHFSINPNKNIIVTLEGGANVYAIDYAVIEDQKQFRERLTDGRFYHISVLSASKFNLIVAPSNGYKTSLPYDSGGVLSEYIKKYDNLEVVISKSVSEYANVLEGLSFGLEFETTAGFLPDRILNTTGLIPLRDGSIPGIEFVTVPMTGEKGLQSVVNAVTQLESRTRYDNSCALHMHIGNVPRTPEFLMAMLKVTCALQDEMYTLFPLYKKYNFGVKNKNYSKPYPVFDLMSQIDPVITKSNIDANFNILYSYLSMGESFYDRECDLKNVQTHPADRDARAKWNITTRYYLNNMIPLIFGNKQTIEFRIHTATLNVNKIVPFMLINAAIVNYTIKNTSKILEDPLFLNTADNGRRQTNIYSIFHAQVSSSKIRTSYLKDSLLSSINNYLNHRRERTAQDNKRGDIIGSEDKIQGARGIDWVGDKGDYEDLDGGYGTKPLQNRKYIEDNHRVRKSNIISSHTKGLLSATEANKQMQEVDAAFIRDRNLLREKGQW